MKRIIILFFLLQVGIFSAISQSTVWTIEGNSTKIYVGGSIHILREQDYPLPKEFEEAYKNAEILVTELDVDAMNLPSNMQKIQTAMIYEGDETLKGVLTEDVYNKLDSVCNAYGMNLGMMNKFKPSMVIIALTFQALNKLSVATEGVDMYFTKKAISDEKTRLYLETFDEQLGFLESMGDENENEFILYSLQDIEENNEVFIDLIEAWKAGEIELISSELLDFKDDFPEIYNSLVLERNNNWISHLESYFETPKVEFVVVGAMHLFGTDGILERMKEKGYNVKQL